MTDFGGLGIEFCRARHRKLAAEKVSDFVRVAPLGARKGAADWRAVARSHLGVDAGCGCSYFVLMEWEEKKGDRWLRLGDLAPHEVIVVSCPCGRSVEYHKGFLQRRHRVPSDTLVYDLQFRLR